MIEHIKFSSIVCKQWHCRWWWYGDKSTVTFHSVCDRFVFISCFFFVDECVIMHSGQTKIQTLCKKMKKKNWPAKRKGPASLQIKIIIEILHITFINIHFSERFRFNHWLIPFMYGQEWFIWMQLWQMKLSCKGSVLHKNWGNLYFWEKTLSQLL